LNKFAEFWKPIQKSFEDIIYYKQSTGSHPLMLY
jgi:hypothetical protein